MSFMAMAFIFSAVCFTFVGIMWLKDLGIFSREPKRELTINEKLYFGLHFRPYKEIKDRLPELPGGYFWKGSIVNKDGQNFVRFAICDLVTEEELYANLISVTREKSYSSVSWQEYYDRYSSIARKSVWNGIVPPMISWANDRVLRVHGNDDNEEIF